MAITTAVAAWWIPVGVTLVVWGWAILMPSPSNSGGMYDFSGPLSALFRLTLAVIVTLAAWLIWAVLT